MPNLKDIKRRIGSVKNTRQITRAMKMVAVAKLKKATDRAVAARPYQQALTRVLSRVAEAAGGDITHPLLTAHDKVETVLVIVMGSDRGLCGSYNGNLLRKVEYFAEAERGAGRKLEVRTYGKKARNYFNKRGYTVASSVIDLRNEGFMDAANELSREVAAAFESGEVQQVVLAYNHFKSAGSQVVSIQQILPLAVDEKSSNAGPTAEYSYEPNGQQILDTLLPLQLRTILLQALLENEAGEHAARMQAMDSATRNAEELIQALTLQYNRARQAAITTEIIEVISGASAL